MNTKMLVARSSRRPTDVGVMMALALGVVFAPVIVIDLVALIQAALS